MSFKMKKEPLLTLESQNIIRYENTSFLCNSESYLPPFNYKVLHGFVANEKNVIKYGT